MANEEPTAAVGFESASLLFAELLFRKPTALGRFSVGQARTH